jgi:hypothetical protein
MHLIHNHETALSSFCPAPSPVVHPAKKKIEAVADFLERVFDRIVKQDNKVSTQHR